MFVENAHRASASLQSGRVERLRRLFAPRSVALVGVKPSRGYGLSTLDNLRKVGFLGQIGLVHPRLTDVNGYPAVPSLRDLDFVPDAVAIAVPAQYVPRVLAQVVEIGVPGGAIVYASGFAESESSKLQSELSIAAGTLPYLGPNCLGFTNYRERVALWGIDMPHWQTETSNRVAIISQSGNLALTAMSSNRIPGIGFAISLGNQSSVDLVDCLDYLLDDADDDLKVIGLAIEGINEPLKLYDALLRAHDAGKQIVALKIGRSEGGRNATVAHTGTLAGRDAMYDALFTQTGCIRVSSLEEFESTLSLFATATRRNTSVGLSVMANSGGECGLFADVADGLGVSLTPLSSEATQELTVLLPSFANIRNPLDMTATAWGHPTLYGDVVRSLAQQPDTGLIAFVGDSLSRAGDPDSSGWRSALEIVATASRETGVPVMVVTTSTDVSDDFVEACFRLDLGFTAGMRPALVAIRGWARTHAWDPSVSNQLRAAIERSAAALLANRSAHDRVIVPEAMVKRELQSIGIASPLGVQLPDVDSASERCAGLRYPLVCKIQSADVAHKTEIGGVLLGIKDETELKAAVSDLLDLGRGLNDATAHVLVEEQVDLSQGVELIVGSHNELGATHVVVGLGGVLTELLGDSNSLLWPFSGSQVETALRGLAGSRLLTGFRGSQPIPLDELVRAVIAIGEYMSCQADVVELEINPLFVNSEGRVTALDALMTRLCLP